MSVMKRREFITLLGGAATANVSWPMTTRAQVPERHIGVLMGLAEDDRHTKARLSGLRQGLEKLGWVEGRNVRIDYRFAPAGGSRRSVREGTGWTRRPILRLGLSGMGAQVGCDHAHDSRSSCPKRDDGMTDSSHAILAFSAVEHHR